MCGIFGIYSINKSCKFTDLLDVGMREITHRGPDGSGKLIIEEKIGIGHHRLAIQDLSVSGAQPMRYEFGGKIYHIVYNGEIYNKEELRQLTGLDYADFNGESDTEVLIKYLAAKIGIQSLESVMQRINGIYAFAFYNETDDELYLIRDDNGVKPLYIYESSDSIVFSSEIKALIPVINNLRGGGLAVEDININSVAKYLNFQYCPGNETMLKFISKAEPGVCNIYKKNTDGKFKIAKQNFSDRYNSFSKSMSIKSGRYIEYREALDYYLRSAVHKQLISDAPLGAFLSGGLDSSAVVLYAKEKLPNIECYTIDAKGAGSDGFVNDLPYAEKVARHLNVNLNVVKVTEDDFINYLPQMVYLLDEPLADSAPLNVYFISEFAKKNGVKVLLSGAGGDDILTGYRRHIALKYTRFFQYIPLSMRRYFKNYIGSLNSKRPAIRRLKQLSYGLDLPRNEQILQFFRRAQRSDFMNIFSERFKNRLNMDLIDLPMIEHLSSIPPDLSEVQSILELEKRFYLADHNLIYTDKMSMAASVEVRVPFLDPDLIKFSRHIPDKYLINNLHAKWIFKDLMSQYLPKDIIYRPKTGFGLPVKKWMNTSLKEWVDSLLTKDAIERHGIFNYKEVMNILRMERMGFADYSNVIFSIICIEAWLSKFVD